MSHRSDSESAVEASLQLPDYNTQFIPQDDDEETLWDVIEILAERGSRYQVKWAGNDPATTKPWAPSWVPKHDCTDQLIHDWKVKQAKKKKDAVTRKSKSRASTSSSRDSKPSASTAGNSTARRAPSHASSSTKLPASTSNASHVSSSRIHKASSSHGAVSKRRKVSHESSEEDDPLAVPAPTGKRRKVAIEVMLSAAKGKGRQNVPDDHSLYEVRSTSSPVVPSPPRQVTKIGPSKRSKPLVIVSSESHNDLEKPTASNETAASVHKSKPRNVSRTNSTNRSAPASSRVAIRDQTVEGIASRRNKTLVDSRTTKTATKVMRPIPVVSPSVFHPHLPKPDPPLSSIEQFSSPEKGGVHATSMAIRRAEKRLKEKGKGGQVASKWDDETLQQRGQQLADEAASSRRSSSRSPPLDEDNDWLFEMPSNPGSPQNADETGSIGPSPIPSSPRGTSISVDPVAQEVVDAFINFGDEPEDGWGLATHEEQAMTLGPDLTAARRKAGPLQQLRGSHFEANWRLTFRKRRIEQVSMPEEPTQSLDYLPATTSTQQAAVDSQSQVTRLETESTELKERHALSVSELEVKSQALLHADARHGSLEEKFTAFRLEHERGKVEMEQAMEAQQEALRRLQSQKEDTEKEREIFREYYGKASAHASEVATEKNELERQLKLTMSQLKEGLPMLKGMYEERIRRIEAELEKWKTLCKVLTDKDERTNDDVRRRAALALTLQEENTRLKEEWQEIRHAASKMDDDLRSLAERTSQHTAATRNDVQSQTEHEPESLMDIEQPKLSAASDQISSQELGDAHTPVTSQQLLHSVDSKQHYTADEPAGAHFFVCQHVSGTAMCYARFGTSEEVVRHAFDSHYQELREIENSV
ncbi:hypothetical protein POSPLADRAFT_1176054 [Postia placenta MAD-698-R-SB12]|uniref:Chromo domain-containing protein n=1 Tax=Postia placenta MAD-698-R-SB12 TaxID=670580 RepID=A0A1X6NF60_9APHY|nr:hypothetical protein POSPLADRAFT_1176054 [Postia placenta MAD-698-R-SB12]OSX67279.1 hypothetical protein POSPLADRAFT_1176054 [Postia placenta MAD-698-R-SB12]